MFVILILSLGFLVGCGGGGDSANADTGISPDSGNSTDLTQQCADPKNCTEAEIVKILELPDEPDPELNHATTLGVGSDDDGVRDDLERKIGFTLFHDNQARAIYTRQAQIWTEMVQNENDVAKLKDLLIENMLNVSCIVDGYIESKDSLKSFEDQTAMGFNRLILRNKLRSKVSDSYGYQQFPSDSQVKTYCESFK
tara:strand:- start:20 stop:610 length:591 start_codon:yes stop_codon:yes gene_type:complete